MGSGLRVLGGGRRRGGVFEKDGPCGNIHDGDEEASARKALERLGA
jgi:hypothetical protein